MAILFSKGNIDVVKRPDFERAKQYALKRLEEELNPELSYHAASHTRDDVVPAAERLANLAGIPEDEKLLLITAAWFHDLGNIVQREGHEAISVQIAREILPDFDYTAEQIETIAGIIMATKLPQSPKTLLEKLMADADLDSLGREDFWPSSQFLRMEIEALGEAPTPRDWLRWQLEFLREHEYFTTAARELRNAGKKENIQMLIAALGEGESD